MTDPVPVSDPLDRDIARLLAHDARTSYRQIAAAIGVTEGTVRARVQRLQVAGLLRFEPIVDMASALAAGDEHAMPVRHMVFMTVRCHAGQLDRVRDALLALPGIEALYDANAAHRLVAIAMVETLAQAAAMTDAVLALDGIRDAESEIVLETIKYDATIAPIATVEAARQRDAS